MHDVDHLLVHAVGEAASLLDADGAMVYLLDPETGVLRFAHDAGIEREDARRLVGRIELPVGTGMFGRAVAERSVITTDDYANDPSFVHAPDTDRVVDDVGIRSMVVAPLVSGDVVFGALGTFSTRAEAFNPAQIALVRALADHSAAAMANARLIDALDRSRAELTQRAEVERTLRGIAARISAASDLGAVLQRSVDEAARLLDAETARIDLIDPDLHLLRWAYASGAQRPSDDVWPDDPNETLDQGVSGQAVVLGRPFWTGNYVEDDRFPHGAGSDHYARAIGIRSVLAAPLIGEGGPFGALTVLASRPDAWGAPDAELLAAIADQAAITITTTRLIEELGRSREEQARTAEAERALREIAARMTAMRDQGEILTVINDEAARLLRGSGSMINLVGSTDLTDAWVHLAGRVAVGNRVDLLEEVDLEPDAGVSGLAFRTRKVQWTDDYERDQRFIHTAERDAFVRETGIRSVISAPLVRDQEVLGVLTVYAEPLAAFGPEDAALLVALADQGAVTIVNARLIDELERSREEVARRAESERTLREIAARVSAILDPGEVLQLIVEEAARLLASDGARIDLFDESLGALRWAYAAGDTMRSIPDWAATGGLKPRQAVAGLAFAEQRPIVTADYLADDRFETTPEIEAFIRSSGIRAVIAAPLAGDRGSLGTISVVSRTPGAYRESDADLLTALATHASIALTNARLMEELEGSRAVIERRAEAEQALREIAARITAIREPGDLLQHVIDEAARLLRADGALIDLYDPATDTLYWAYDAGLPDEQRESVKRSRLRIGEGVSGKAVAERRVIVIDDYTGAEDFVHSPTADELARASGIRSLIAAPIITEDGPLGAVEVFRHTPGAFDAIDAAVLGGLADQAAVAMTNARLIEELARSQRALERRAETERSLRDITGRITSLRDPREVLERVVEDAKRLLDSDGAHLTRLADDGSYLVPVVVAGGDPDTAEWIKTQEFPLGGGINGLAAEQGVPVWTRDYQVDERIPHERDDEVAATRLGLRGMAAAPLRAPGGEVIGTLAVSFHEPRDVVAEELALLQGLADQAAIALTNSNLLQRLTASEGRYRHLVQNSPDLIYSIGPDARLTFVSDTCERLTGWHPYELVGRHFGALVHASSREVAEIDWASDLVGPSQELRGRVNLLRRDGSAVPAEFTAMATLDADGRFAGANGSVRDMTETDRLERELRDSENRYRDLASSSPDIVFSTDPDGNYTFLSDAATKLMGWDRERAIGRPFTEFVPEHARHLAAESYQAILEEPDRVHHARIPFLDGSGREVPLEINVIGSLEDGRLHAIHGVARDVSERERLERDLRRQAGELASSEERAHLARELHDSVTQALFSMTLVARSVELLLDRDPDGARAQLLQLRELQREALAEMRALIFELRPGNVEQDGLERALRTHTTALQGRIGLPIVVESELDERLPLEIEETLYRISQEALHNVVKHAAARQVRLEIRRIRGGVRLRIEDDGKGFDPARVPDGHLGLAGMRARATKIDAQLECRSEPGRGTTIEAFVPDTVLDRFPASSRPSGVIESVR